jgi:hypothetical protein
MKSLAALIAFAGITGLATPAFAQFQQVSVFADSEWGSTAGGIYALSEALGQNDSGNCGTQIVCFETAFGGGALREDENGMFNTGIGYGALSDLSQGNYNTALGYEAAESLSNVSYNTAIGYQTMGNSYYASSNTAVGALSLYSTTGPDNTAVGLDALYSDTTGFGNTATGMQSMLYNLTGNYNTAVGFWAMEGTSSTTSSASYNTALGSSALGALTTGNYNVASGYYALHGNTSGVQNTADGSEALLHNTRGGYNTAVGMNALSANTSGSMNIGLGYKAGSALNTGSNNIDIGSVGTAGESGVIRIGSSAQTQAFVAGIYGTSTDNSYLPVMVNSSGRLGVGSQSSERFKTDIAPMGSSTTSLGKLRPVRYHFKRDASNTQYYGLIAEEVARVYPELVVHGPNGRIDGVRYDELAPMLLNVVQQQAAEISKLKNDQAGMQAALLELQRAAIAGDKTAGAVDRARR